MNELLMEGLLLMGVGMGVVFLFLGLLVGLIAATSSLIQKLEARVAGSGVSSLNDTELVDILTEAVKRYREDHPNL